MQLIVQCDICSLIKSIVLFIWSKLFCVFCLAFSPIFSLIKTGHSANFGPAVSHLFCSGFTEIWNNIKHLIQARYEILNKGEKSVVGSKNGVIEDISQTLTSYLDKDLDAALDSFDNLFCRRCLVSFLFSTRTIDVPYLP